MGKANIWFGLELRSIEKRKQKQSESPRWTHFRSDGSKARPPGPGRPGGLAWLPPPWTFFLFLFSFFDGSELKPELNIRLAHFYIYICIYKKIISIY